MKTKMIITMIMLAGAIAFGQASTNDDLFKLLVRKGEQETALLNNYGKALDSAMADLKKKGDLDTYLVFETEKKRFDEQKNVPPPADIKDAFKVPAGEYYKARLALLKKHIIELDNFIKAEMLADRMESAKSAKTEKDKAAQEVADLESIVPPADTKSQKKIVIWNSHHSGANNLGTLMCDVTLFNRAKIVWQEKNIDVPWVANVDTNLVLYIPDKIYFDKVRVDITKWMPNEGASGTLAEIEVYERDRNISSGCNVTASSAWIDRATSTRFYPDALTDGITTSAEAFKGYWAAAGNGASWVEVDLTKKHPLPSATRKLSGPSLKGRPSNLKTIGK